MKKARLFTLLTLLLTLTLLLLVGCEKEDAVSSLSLKGYGSDTAIEISLGDFDYNAYTLVVTRKSGSTEETALTKEMIVEADLPKFYQEGVHDVTVNYGGCTCTFKISVKRSEFADLRFSENNVFTYDGKAHGVEVEGTIPANAVITYVGGNSFINAGTYDVHAIVSCEGYVTARLSTTVKIERAQYDMSGVKFNSKEFVYDGQYHSVSISGTLPKGVSSPTYYIGGKETSSALDAGEYKVIAKFSNTNPNYEAIPDMETTLKILPAEYTVKGVNIVFKKEDGKLFDEASKIYDGTSVLFDLDDYSKLSKKISVSFSVSDEDGNVISTSNKITNIKNAGVYTVKVEFTLADSKNYQPIPPLVSTFEVFKAEYPTIKDVSLVSAQTTYDSKEHNIVIDGKLPDGVSVSYEYYRGDTLIVDDDGNPVQAVIGTGIYTVKAVFAHNDKNYGKIPDISATLHIKKSQITLSMIGFLGENSVEYSAGPYEPKFTTWQEAFVRDYDILEYATVKYYVYDDKSGMYVEMGENEYPTDVGLYKAAIEIKVSEEHSVNYVLPGTDVQTLVKQFEIKPTTIEVGNVSVDGEYTYNGSHQLPVLKDVPEHVNATPYIYSLNGTTVLNEVVDAGEYRIEVVFTPENSNYVLSSNETIVLSFEIKPQKIEVVDLKFDTTEFLYDGSAHQPALENLPLHVNSRPTLYASIANDVLPIFGEVINAGKYSITLRLSAENSNYVLSDGTEEKSEIIYSTEFTIKSQPLDLDTVLENGVKIVLKDGGYDSAALAAALAEALFGDMSDKVEIVVSDIYNYIAEKVDVANGVGEYSAICHIEVVSVKESIDSYIYDVVDRYNYSVLHDGKGKISFGIEIHFEIVDET